MDPSALDHFDRRLLELLQDDALATAAQLTGQVPLSPSAIARRVRRLRADGWIRADVALLARALTETRLRALLLVQAREHAEERGLADLRARLCAAPEVQLVLDISGSHDLAVLVSARDMADFNALTDRLLEKDPAVNRYETSFVKRVHKQREWVPLSGG